MANISAFIASQQQAMTRVVAVVDQHISATELSMQAFTAAHKAKMADLQRIVQTSVCQQATSLRTAKDELQTMAAARETAMQAGMQALQQQMGIMMQAFAAEQTTAWAADVAQSSRAIDASVSMGADIDTRTTEMIAFAGADLSQHTQTTAAAAAAHGKAIATLVTTSAEASTKSNETIEAQFLTASGKMDELAGRVTQQCIAGIGAVQTTQQAVAAFIGGQNETSSQVVSATKNLAEQTTQMTLDTKAAVNAGAAAWQVHVEDAISSLAGAAGALSQKVGGIGDRLSIFNAEVRLTRGSGGRGVQLRNT